MKKIFLLLFLIPVFATAQPGVVTDSTVFRVGKFSIQVREAEILRDELRGDIYLDFLDSLNYEFRRFDSIQSGPTVYVIDSADAGVYINLFHFINQAPFWIIGGSTYTRLESAIKAIPSSYLQRQITSIEASYAGANQRKRKDARRLYNPKAFKKK